MSIPNFVKKEEEILGYWEKERIFERSISERPEEKLFVFYDGPPFATGMPHYGHIVASVMKDVVPRFWTMRGYRVNRTWGWDCHGLPIENIVEKKFDLHSKADIEKLGVDTFNDRCHAEVMTYANDWKAVIRRLGRWVDMENAYKTMDVNFMESIWWVFKQLWEKGLIYEGYKSMHICPRCETVLSKFEVNEGYQMVKDLSAFATFRLLDGAYAGSRIIAWTTTPWTLPGNVLLAVGEKIAYALVQEGDDRYIVAKALVEKVFQKKEHEVVSTFSGSELVGATYEPLFPYFADHKNAFRVVSADFVTTEEGTGIVHIAPGFGEDDKALGEAEGVAPIMHVGMDGRFVDAVADPLEKEGYKVKGIPVKSKGDTMSIDVEMVRALAHMGKLFHKEKFEHSYPHCWRCDTPLINYATTSWFVSVAKSVPSLLETAKEIQWTPAHIKEGRFGNGLEASPDWSISRSRYWGTPLPLWRADDGEIMCVGSVSELAELTGESITDLHKQFVDQLVIEKDGKTYRRVPEVLDCWFESGSMPYAQLHYPFENETPFTHGFPAQFIAEGVDQTGLWFHKLHVLAGLLFEKPAFKHVIVNGIVLAEDGKKMSKRLQNYPDPMDVMQRYGSDAVRQYLMSSPVVRAENLRFSESGVEEVSKKLINIVNNVVSFFSLYKGGDDGRMPSKASILDAWMLARLHQDLRTQTDAMEAYDLQTAARVLQSFATDLSTWYVRRSRDRFKEEGEDKQEAIATLRVVLETYAKMLAPFMPFLAESVYQTVQGDFSEEERPSVHLESWPESEPIDAAVIEMMGQTRSVVSRALEARAEAGINVRQPLSVATVTLPSGTLDHSFIELIKDEVNVKSVAVQTGEYAVELDTTLTSELVREGTIREMIRRINAMRKDAKLTIEDRVNLFVQSSEPDVKTALEEHADVLLAGTLADSLRSEGDDPAYKDAFRVNEFDIILGFDVIE